MELDRADLYAFALAAEEVGVNIEQIGHLRLWDAPSSILHQATIDDVRASLSPEWEDRAFVSVWVFLPDGSLRRPDIALYAEPPALTNEALAVLPIAVIEIASGQSVRKDLLYGAGNYLMNGVLEVLVLDLDAGRATRMTPSGTRQSYERGDRLRLECGCELTL